MDASTSQAGVKVSEAIERMLENFQLQSGDDYSLALHEIIQEVALLGLSRAGFFNKAAFYGGTALRLLYKLDRFSEDLDFSLLKADKNFSLIPYLETLQEELQLFSFNVDIEAKKKSKESAIESAFIKANTKEHLITIETPGELTGFFSENQKVRIKFEVDTNPPLGFETEMKYLLNPTEFSIRCFTLPNLFAGKMHDVLYRNWKKRVKGRDRYDLIWYVRNKTKLNVRHLEKRIEQSENIKLTLTPDLFRELLKKRIEEVDLEAAKKDVERFVRNPIKIWSRDFFNSLLEQIEFE